MSDWTPRLVIAVVAVVVAVSAVALLRSRQTAPVEVAPEPGSFGVQATRRASRDRPGYVGSTSGDDPSSSSRGLPPLPRRNGLDDGPRDAAPRQLSDVGDSTAESESGRRLAAEPIPREVLEAYAEGPSRLGPVSIDPEALAALPEGTALAIPFDSSSDGIDATRPIIDENVYYDAPGGAYFAPDARLAYGNRGGVQNESGTIAFWVRPGWEGAEPADNSFIQLRTHAWDNRLHVFKNGVFLRFLISDDNGIEHNVGADISRWAPDTWYHVAVTWGEDPLGEFEQVTSLYVNSALQERNPHNGKLNIPEGTPLFVGSDRTGGAPGANSTIANLRVMEFGLTPQEIQQLYYETRPAE